MTPTPGVPDTLNRTENAKTNNKKDETNGVAAIIEEKVSYFVFIWLIND